MAKIETFKRGKADWIRTLENIEFSLAGVTYTIPAGFECDGASIPRLFWRIIGPPISCDYIDEAIKHDWLYRVQTESRLTTDRIFFHELGKKGLHIRRYFIYIAVRLFGWIAWEKNQKGKK